MSDGGFAPLHQDGRTEYLTPRPPLAGVIRVSKTTHQQIHVRVAEDIVEAMGWEDGCMLRVLVGHGKLLGKVRFIAADHPSAPKEGHLSRLARLKRSRSRTICFSSRAIGVTKTFEVFTAPHQIDAAGLTVDLSHIVKGEL